MIKKNKFNEQTPKAQSMNLTAEDNSKRTLTTTGKRVNKLSQHHKDHINPQTYLVSEFTVCDQLKSENKQNNGEQTKKIQKNIETQELLKMLKQKQRNQKIYEQMNNRIEYSKQTTQSTVEYMIQYIHEINCQRQNLKRELQAQRRQNKKLRNSIHRKNLQTRRSQQGLIDLQQEHQILKAKYRNLILQRQNWDLPSHQKLNQTLFQQRDPHLYQKLSIQNATRDQLQHSD